MGIARATFIFLILLLCSNFSKAQTDDKDPTWTIDCKVWDSEAKDYVSIGQRIEKKYQIGYAPVLKIGIVYAQNNSGEWRELKLIDVVNGYDPEKALPWWFYAAGSLTGNPGDNDWLEVSFIGQTKDNGWVDEGIYESTLTFEDQTDGTRYEVPVIVYAVAVQ